MASTLCTALEQCASAKLRRSAEGATNIRQGGHRIGHRAYIQVCPDTVRPNHVPVVAAVNVVYEAEHIGSGKILPR